MASPPSPSPTPASTAASIQTRASAQAIPGEGVYNPVSGNSQGEFQQVGNGVGSVFRSRPSPYLQQWLLGVQYAITPNDSLEVSYIGNRGTRMIANSYQHNQMNPQYLSMGTAALQAQGRQSVQRIYLDKFLQSQQSDDPGISVAFTLSAVLLNERR